MKFFSLILFLASTLTYSQSIDLNKWVEKPFPLHTELDLPNYYIAKDKNDDSFKIQTIPVLLDAIPTSTIHTLIEKKFGINNGKRTIKKVFNGYLISYADGEFGGNLYFISDGNKKSYLIAERTRIKFFIETDNELFAFGGLANLGTSRGSAYKLNYKRKWKLEYLKNLQADPLNIIQNNKNIYIISSENLLKFKPDDKLNTVLTFPFNLGIFYPTSSVIIKNDLYIAMRSGVLKVKNFSYKPTFHWLEEKE